MSDEHDHEHGHTTLVGYFGVFFALMIGTVLTVLAATVDFNGFDIYVALLIAFTKASLVLYFFMHLRESPVIVKAIGLMGFLFLGVLMLFFVTDVLARPDAYQGAWGSKAEQTYQELGITPLHTMVDPDAPAEHH